MNSDIDYWKDCIAEGADECELILTEEQLVSLARTISISHEHYGMAFYSPPASDQVSAIEREHQKKMDALQREFDQYRGHAECALKRVLHVGRDANIGIDRDGMVRRYDGRSDVIA